MNNSKTDTRKPRLQETSLIRLFQESLRWQRETLSPRTPLEREWLRIHQALRGRGRD